MNTPLDTTSTINNICGIYTLAFDQNLPASEVAKLHARAIVVAPTASASKSLLSTSISTPIVVFLHLHAPVVLGCLCTHWLAALITAIVGVDKQHNCHSMLHIHSAGHSTSTFLGDVSSTTACHQAVGRLRCWQITIVAHRTRQPSVTT